MKIFEHLLSLLAWLMFAAFFICLFQLMSGCATPRWSATERFHKMTMDELIRSCEPTMRGDWPNAEL